MIEKGQQDLTLKRPRRVALEADGAERGAVQNLLTVVPGAEDQKDFVVIRVLWLDGFVHGGRTVDVFLIPQAVDEHHGDGEWLSREHTVNRLIAPERVVARMLEDLPPES